MDLSTSCRRGEQGQRVVTRPRQQRVADPHRIEAELFGPRREVEQWAGLGSALHDPLPGRQQVSDARRHFVSPLPPPASPRPSLPACGGGKGGGREKGRTEGPFLVYSAPPRQCYGCCASVVRTISARSITPTFGRTIRSYPSDG